MRSTLARPCGTRTPSQAWSRCMLPLPSLAGKPAAGNAKGPARCVGPLAGTLRLGPRDVCVLGFGQEQQTDDEAHGCYHGGVPQARIDVSRSRNDGEHGGWQKTAEPAVANVI